MRALRPTVIAPVTLERARAAPLDPQQRMAAVLIGMSFTMMLLALIVIFC